MTEPSPIGRPTGGKPINLAQLQTELGAAGVAGSALGQVGEYVSTYDADGAPVDFPAAERTAVDFVIAAHVAMRDKTADEYAAEFQDPNTTPGRRQEIRDITAGLLPPEQVPM